MVYNRRLHNAPPPPPQILYPYEYWIPGQYIWNTPANYSSDAYAMMTNRLPPPIIIDPELVVDASTSPLTSHDERNWNTAANYDFDVYVLTDNSPPPPPPPPPPMIDTHLFIDASTSPLTIHDEHNWNTAANYDFDVYVLMDNSPPPPPPPMIDGHLFIDASTPPHTIHDEHIWNTSANYDFDGYVSMDNSPPPPPWMIDAHLLIDASTPPHTIHDQLQMMDDHAIMDIDLNRNRGGRLSEEAISEHVKTRAATREDANEICTVCQDDLYEEGNNVFIATLDCGHGYHENCIKRWLLEKNACPLCKAVAIVTADM